MNDRPSLRHLASLALRDLIDLAQRPDFDRVEEQIRRVRGCTHPVNLVGQTTTLDADTHTILRSYSTADEPTGRLLTACGNRRASRCPSCSRLYAADTYHLVKAGLSGGKIVPETVREHPRVFATLTAPSFGPVHNRRTTDAGEALPCRCGTVHTTDAPELGTPLIPATYDYSGAVLWNAHAGALWARFTTYLRRELAAPPWHDAKGAERSAQDLLRQGRRVPETRPGPLPRRDPPRRPRRPHRRTTDLGHHRRTHSRTRSPTQPNARF